MVRLLLVKERVVRSFQRFKSGDFDVEDRHGGGKENIFEDSELEALLAEHSCQRKDQWKSTWKRWNGRSYTTQRTLQTLLLPTTICFDRWHTAWLISIFALIKKLKNGSICGSPQKTHRFFEMVSDHCQKDGKSSD